MPTVSSIINISHNIGDLTDGKSVDKRGSNQFEEEWKIYAKLLEENSVLDNTIWLDVRGNHGKTTKNNNNRHHIINNKHPINPLIFKLLFEDNFGVLNKSSQTNFFK